MHGLILSADCVSSAPLAGPAASFAARFDWRGRRLCARRVTGRTCGRPGAVTRTGDGLFAFWPGSQPGRERSRKETSVRVAYQGEPGAFSEAAVMRLLPDADPRPYPTFDEVFDAVHERCGEPRRRPDREFDRRLDPSQLRPAGRTRTVDRRRGPGAGGAQPARAAGRASSPRCGGCCRTRRRWRSARASCGRLDGVEAIATYDTAGSAKMVRDEQRRDTAAIASERAGMLFGLDALRAGRAGFRRQHHALPRDRPPARAARHRPTRRRSCSRCGASRARCSRR